jgi:hypothetical protein
LIECIDFRKNSFGRIYRFRSDAPLRASHVPEERQFRGVRGYPRRKSLPSAN